MRKLALAAAGFALLAASAAFAQSYTWAPSQGGAVGAIVSATDNQGNTRRVVLPTVASSVPANFTPAQVSVATTATQIVAARTGRNLLTVVNTTTTPIYLGGASVTTSTGLLLPGTVGASLTLSYSGALYGIVASGTATVTEAETY